MCALDGVMNVCLCASMRSALSRTEQEIECIPLNHSVCFLIIKYLLALYECDAVTSVLAAE